MTGDLAGQRGGPQEDVVPWSWNTVPPPHQDLHKAPCLHRTFLYLFLYYYYQNHPKQGKGDRRPQYSQLIALWAACQKICMIDYKVIYFTVFTRLYSGDWRMGFVDLSLGYWRWKSHGQIQKPSHGTRFGLQGLRWSHSRYGLFPSKVKWCLLRMNTNSYIVRFVLTFATMFWSTI